MSERTRGELFKLAKDREGERIGEDGIEQITSILVEGALDRRSAAGGLKGEWIVFLKAPATNLYLCLALHSESHEQIYAKVATALREYGTQIRKDGTIAPLT